MLYWAPMMMAVFSNVLYHVFQKSIPVNVNPVFSLVMTYLTAAATSLLLIPFFPAAEGFTETFRRLNLASIGLGMSIVGLELGFLLAYRAGWNINIGGVVCSVLVGLFLIPVGYAFFKETISMTTGLGIILCIIGLILINRS
ncbi:EamA family transporter [Limisalsivibrio acetivorans]|uniref:EamA family transporter n=1 Tax=Limisalsivibrio acetivorans TaxID=1304888 RepID=UPI0003B4CE21|nr:EamA family transporter [Limisalsivibrio acetivorans]